MGQMCSPSAEDGAGNMDQPKKPEPGVERFSIKFESKPLGFGCDQGDDQHTLFVSSVQKRELMSEQGLKIGALIVGINGKMFHDNATGKKKSYEEMIQQIRETALPLTINFEFNPHTQLPPPDQHYDQGYG